MTTCTPLFRPAITPAGKDHFAVFSAFHRQWDAFAWRSPVATPKRLHVPAVRGAHAPGVEGAGGETAGRKRMNAWLRSPVTSYVDNHDLVGVDGTSRLSPYLHFGCVSALELARRAVAAPEFVRQFAWQDFHHQVLAARPDAAREDYRPHGDRWLDDVHALEAWRAGETGYPIVDASFLTKTLYLDWRAGADTSTPTSPNCPVWTRRTSHGC